MTSSNFSYGSIEVYLDKVLGIGSYGKVCKAKCGQLHCAAKLLHDTLFQDNDPGTNTLARKFEQECQFLSNIKHPNVVQYLGTIRDSISQRPVLLMELMDESLTRFLERFTVSLPYHSQVNICHDVALALAYLHSNTIIHRDLSSNNVLLIGEGNRAKVTDFGMSKLTEMNPHMTPLTQCPGTSVYMPPEALFSPPHYSSKLDIFSHGVLIIQIITRNFPNPGDAITYIDDPKYPSGRLFIQNPEADRRMKDIDLIEAGHPLLPLALLCIKDKDMERPSADELCEGLVSLKSSARYRDSLEQTREQASAVQRLQLELELREQELQRTRNNYERVLEQATEEYQKVIEKLNSEKERLVAELRDCQVKQQQYRKAMIIQRNAKSLKHCKTESAKNNSEASSVASQQELEQTATSQTLTWRQGEEAPENISSLSGAAVVHGNTVYFSQFYNIYSYTLSEDRWILLQEHEFKEFSVAIVNDTLTSIGGFTSDYKATKSLLSLSGSGKWEKFFPPMPTPRVLPATVTTATHLMVAGGRNRDENGLSAVEVMDTKTHLWFIATSLPQEIPFPLTATCCGYFYISNGNTVFSCSVEKLLQSCQNSSDKSTSINSSSCKVGSVWTRLADIPVDYGPVLATLGGHVLTVGGDKRDQLTGAIHCYERTTDSWTVIGEMPTPRRYSLVVLMSSSELIIVGGMKASMLYCNITEIYENI